MHEASLIDGMLRIASRELAKNAARSVSSITVRVGAMSGALPDALSFAFFAARDGIFRDAELTLLMEPVEAKCADCGKTYRPRGFPYVCPECGGSDFRLTGGEDVYIESIEYEV